MNQTTEAAIQPGQIFDSEGCRMLVVKPNERLPGDWWCKSLEAETGLWSYSPSDILRGRKE